MSHGGTPHHGEPAQLPVRRSARVPRPGIGPLLALGVVLGALLVVFGAVVAGGYAAGAPDRSAYDAATACGARDPRVANCRQDLTASVDAVTPVTYVQQSARSSRIATAAWDVTLALRGADRTVRLSTQPLAMFTGDHVTAEVWRDRVTGITDGTVTYTTDDSPDAYGAAPLAVGLGVAGGGVLVAAASGAALWRRRRLAR